MSQGQEGSAVNVVKPMNLLQPFLDNGCEYEYTTATTATPSLLIDLNGGTMKADARTSIATSTATHLRTININLKGSATVLKSFKV